MAICNALTSGLSKSCVNNVGGLNKIYVADFDNVTVATGASASGTIVTGITMAASTDFYQISVNKNTAKFDENTAIDLTNGTTVVNQIVTVVLHRRETTKREFIEKLVAGQKQLSLILLDSNGIYWLVGLAEGAYVTAIEGGSGTTKTDANSYTITFTATELEQAFEIDPAIIASIIA